MDILRITANDNGTTWANIVSDDDRVGVIFDSGETASSVPLCAARIVAPAFTSYIDTVNANGAGAARIYRAVKALAEDLANGGDAYVEGRGLVRGAYHDA